MAKLSILSWNINGLRACLNKGLSELLKEAGSDVFCFQEIKCLEAQLNEESRAHLKPAYEDIWHPAKRPGYSGVMTLHRGQIQKTQTGIGEDRFDDEGRVLIHDLGDFELLNCYFPNGGASEDRHFFKMNFLELFLSFVKKRQKQKPLLITGDINIAHRAIDIHDPVRLDGESGFKPEERAWMDALMSAGFVDVFRHFYPDEKEKYTWWSYRAGARQRNKGWRIDYFIASEPLVKRIQKIEHFEKVTGSDHCPLRIEMNA